MGRRNAAGELDWPMGWSQEAARAALPHVDTDDRLRLVVGDPRTSIHGTVYEGCLYTEGTRINVIYDQGGKSDIYPWQLPPGPVLRIELLRPGRRPVLLYSELGWNPPKRRRG